MATNSLAPASSPARIASLATGGFMMLAGLLFQVMTLLPGAQSDQGFLTNIFLSPLLFAIGSTLFIVGLASLGLNRWLTLVLAVLNPAVVLLLLWLASPIMGGGVVITAVLVADGVILLAMSALVAGRQRQWGGWGRALLLALGGLGVVALAYLLFGSRTMGFLCPENAEPPNPSCSPRTGPPYLDLPILGVTLVLGIAAFILGRVWSNRLKQA